MEVKRTANGEMEEERAAGVAPAARDEDVAAEAAAPGADVEDLDMTSLRGEVERLQGETQRLREEADRNWQQFLRAAADLENYRKQAARQREEAVASTRRAMFLVVLDVVDTLERALEHAAAAGGETPDPTAAAITEGIRLAHRQILGTLKTMGVRPMDAVGQPFDPHVHEAVEAVGGADAPPGTIVGEVQRGYLLGDEVLRPARVRVAQ